MADTLPSSINSLTTSSRNKITQVNLITLQTNTVAPRVVISSVLNELDTTNILSVSITIHMGRVVATALSAGVNFRVEMSSATSGDGYWFPVTTFTSTIGAATSTTASVATSLAGQNVITVAAAGSFAVGDIIYIQNATESNSEFARVTVVTGGVNGTLTLEDNLRFNQQVGAVVTNKADMFYGLIDTSSVERLRVVSDGSGAGQNFDCEVKAVVGA